MARTVDPTTAANRRVRKLATDLDHEADQLIIGALQQEALGNVKGGANARNRSELLHTIADRIRVALKEDS